ncbi:hypothetical protein L3X38_017690 [Prunus dulcis]|uniref:Retrovirus-related Pol polyprotein from transposon TNT 1-94 n=1 Tax=Prunus dulcis TaxID=3755 RepID=A0AAD4W9C5_PRUDU|nr:hypothetical protein L3X38_017690 [Prunus dulcis]
MLIGYYDSDWSGSADGMERTSGYAFSLGSGVFSWASIKHSSVALSTVGATQILCDNTSAIAITKNLVHHHKTRHINRRFHFIRDALQNGEIDLLYCKTKEQTADIFTKALAKDHFEYLRRKLGVISAKHLEGSVEV